MALNRTAQTNRRTHSIPDDPVHDETTALRLAAFACGLTVGAAAAVLLAPASGRETRAQIRQQAASAADHTRQAVRERRARLHDFIRRHGVIGLAART